MPAEERLIDLPNDFLRALPTAFGRLLPVNLPDFPLIECPLMAESGH
jgi:hypothetical protein